MNKFFAIFSRQQLRQNFGEHSHIKPFIASVFIFGLAIGIYQNVLNNYLSDILSFSPTERGWAEFLRELPGLCLVAIFALFYRSTESKLIRLAFAISCLGMLGLLLAMEKARWGLFFVVVFSMGDHIFMPIRDAFAMHHAPQKKQAQAMGYTRSVHSLGLILGFACVSLLFYLLRHLPNSYIKHLDFRLSYFIAALFLLAGFTCTLRFSDLKQRIKRQRFYFKKKYWKYYMLEIFFGARKQVFLTFGPYVLILIYGLRTEHLGLLFILHSLLGILLATKLGHLIDRFGYKTMLIIDALLLLFLCLGYGFVPLWLPASQGVWLVAAMFVVDSLLFHISSARNIYARTLGDSAETMATLATGVSLNHLVSVVIAVCGGMLWELLGLQYLFATAAAFALCSMLFCFCLPPAQKSATFSAGRD